MKKVYYKKYNENPKSKVQKQRNFRSVGIVLLALGGAILVYHTFPVIVWHAFSKSTLSNLKAPVPPPFILTPEAIHAMESENTEKNYSNAGITNNSNWLQEYHLEQNINTSIQTYTISIPELDISHALVSTSDFNLDDHLVQYWGTPIPPLQGNTVIFGHSTLPQLFNKNNYRTIFANAHKLKIGDKIFVHLNKEIYTYTIMKSFVTEPDDISVLKQDAKGSYITIVTCTPPGTTWQRLIIKAKLDQ